MNEQGSHSLYAGWIVAIGRDGRHCCYHVAVPVAVPLAVTHVAKVLSKQTSQLDTIVNDEPAGNGENNLMFEQGTNLSGIQSKQSRFSFFLSLRTTNPLLHPRAYSPRPDEKNIKMCSQRERCQRIRLSMTRRPLNGLFRRAVQCRAQSVVNRLHERSHPNKVSMKKRKEEKSPKGRTGERGLYRVEWGTGNGASGKRGLYGEL